MLPFNSSQQHTLFLFLLRAKNTCLLTFRIQQNRHRSEEKEKRSNSFRWEGIAGNISFISFLIVSYKLIKKKPVAFKTGPVCKIILAIVPILVPVAISPAITIVIPVITKPGSTGTIRRFVCFPESFNGFGDRFGISCCQCLTYFIGYSINGSFPGCRSAAGFNGGIGHQA